MNLGKIPVLVWFLIPTVLIFGVGVWFFSKSQHLGSTEDESKPVPVSQAVLGTVDYDVVGRNHIAQGTSGSGYNTNPPTSGPHWPSPVKKGVYDDPLPDEQVIHNLEHGYVWITYKSDVGDEVKNKLKEIVVGDDWKIVLSPRDKNDQKIALVAWGRLLTMDESDYERIREFIRTYRNRGPEKTPE